MTTLIITGTPGTGKSTVARLFARQYHWHRLDLHHYYPRLAERYDAQKQCYVLDRKRVASLIQEKQREYQQLVIDSHISHWLPKKMVNLCVVLVCSDLKLLQRRLKKRRYSSGKIQENVQAEIFQACLEEARKRKHKVIVFDISRMKTKEILKSIYHIIKKKNQKNIRC